MNAHADSLRRRLRHGLLPALLGLALTAAPAAYAQQSELAQLRQQMEQLRAQLARIDARLHELEADRSPVSSDASLPAQGAVAPAVAPSVPTAVPTAVPLESAAAAATATASASAAVPAAPAADAGGGFSPAERATLRDQAQTGAAMQRWTELHTGMSQDEVRSRLGAPQSVLPVDKRTGWVYRYGRAGTGSVFFDHSGRVISLMAPGQGALHLY